MTAKLPPGSYAQRVQFARELMRQQELQRPRVRFSRYKRRMLVSVLFLLVLATNGWLAALGANAVSGSKAFAVLYFSLSAQAIVFTLLTYSTGGLTRPNAHLDERERALRDHATAMAYRILAVVIFAASFTAITANVVFHWLPPNVNPAVGVTSFLLPFLWFVASLPMALLAWTLPDPERDVEA